jgi:intein/homing endonuclease
MDLNENLAEFIGAFVGDGCLSEYKRSDREKGTIKEVSFTGAWEKDYPYYKDVIQPILMKNFNISGTIKHRKDDDSLRLRIFRQPIFVFLLNLGFNFGPKSNNVVIPEKILNDSLLHKAFLRGLFNTDGSIYKRYNKQYKSHSKFYSEYKVIQFKSASKKLIEQVYSILSNLKFNPNNVIKSRDAWVCRITSQNEVNRFGKEIITNHPYHIKRLL